MPISVIKASGERSPFSQAKLRASLQRDGASEEQIGFVVKEVSAKVYDGMSTKEIYRLAFTLLRDSSRHSAARYNLKQGIMDLGPSGFPFEKFVAELFIAQGFTASVGRFVEGKCVVHEVDVVARNKKQVLMIECKYHNTRGIICDVKIPLYIRSRFEDIKDELQKENPGLIVEGWVATNTRFSSDALRYGNCAGLGLLSWDYPTGRSLRELVDKLRLYPVTCLTSLTASEKRKLMEHGVVLSRQLPSSKAVLEKAGISKSRIEVATTKALRLCQVPEAVAEKQEAGE